MSKIYFNLNDGNSDAEKKSEDAEKKTADTEKSETAAEKPVRRAYTKKSVQSQAAATEPSAEPPAKAASEPAADDAANESVTTTTAAETAAADDGVQTAMFNGGEDAGASAERVEGFDKELIFKSFKRRKKPINYKVGRFSPRLNEGLSAAQVETRFSQFLFNDTRNDHSKSYLNIFVSNICTFFNLLCLLAAIALVISGTKAITNYLVVIITVLNIALGIFWEIRSKKAISKLSILASKSAKVVRDGEIVEIPVKEIVLDDVLLLELGNQVPVDCILAEGSVEVNESLLTGESVAIKKNVGDTLYAGSYISSGGGKFRVEKVGEETYLQKLTSKAKKYKKPNSELMNSTKLIIKVVGLLIIPVAIGIFLISKSSYNEVSNYTEDFLFSGQINFAIQRTCSVVIGMIPAGMLLLTSTALSMGVLRLAKKNTLVQDLYSLEMLARVNVLCLDKTGTITDGRMQIKDCLILNTIDDYSLNDIVGSMLKALEDNNQTFIALYNHFGHSDALTPKELIHFSSKRKLSAVTFEDVGTFCMGAPEFVLKPYPLKIEKIVKQYAQMGLRVLVLAHSPSPIVGDKLPAVMKPVAVISIADNIREDAISTIKWFRDNDVAVKVISGDNPITVAEVAKRAGIDGAEKFISLEGLNETEVENVANKYTVFGRVSPEQKAILVRSMKNEGNTVAMTGDGVNDILALKEADCAISVASGSEAATNVSHLVLMDNNFNSMPQIVAEGRRVINNIKNSSSLFLMKTLFTATLAILCIIMQIPYLFLPQNTLLLEVVVIGVPSFFLSLQPNNSRVQGKFISFVLCRAASGAFIMVASVMAMYIMKIIFPERFGDMYLAMCMVVLTFSGLVMLYRVCQPFNGFRCVLFLSMVAMAFVAYLVPFFADMLYKGWEDILWDYASIATIVVIIEAAFPLSQWALNIMEAILPSATDKKKQNV